MEVIRGFCAASATNGVTDETFNSCLNDLQTYNYDYYIDFCNKLFRNEL